MMWRGLQVRCASHCIRLGISNNQVERFLYEKSRERYAAGQSEDNADAGAVDDFWLMIRDMEKQRSLESAGEQGGLL